MDREKRSGSATEKHMGKKVKLSPKKIKLSVGDSVIVADKQRIVAASPYFAGLLRFYPDDLEAVYLVPPGNADPETFLAMLNAISSTSLKLIITAENLWDCIVLSKYFQVEQIEEQCWEAFRKMLPTLAMDELFRLWRNGHACAVDKVATLALVGISLKMEHASESAEFLDLSVDELVALMSDDGFLPLMEENVCKAIKAWCEHLPEDRKASDVLERVLAGVVWDESTEPVIHAIFPQCQKPDTMPKRTVNSDDYRIPDDELLKEVKGSAGIIIGHHLYFLRKGAYDGYCDYDAQSKFFRRVDMNNRELVDRLDLLDIEEMQLDPQDGPKSAESGLTISLCLVRLGGADKIGCFASNTQCLRHMNESDADNVANILSLYDIAADRWEDLPCLPLPRADCAMIQWGSFLYVAGGSEHKALDGDGKNEHKCFRLDLTKLAAHREDQWERIADLNAPRIFHKAKIQYGRIIVYGGKTRTKVADERYKTLEFEDARWSEAYDPTLNCWTALKPEA